MTLKQLSLNLQEPTRACSGQLRVSQIPKLPLCKPCHGRLDDWHAVTVMGAAVTTWRRASRPQALPGIKLERKEVSACAVGRVGMRETLGSRYGREVTEEPQGLQRSRQTLPLPSIQGPGPLQLRATRVRALPVTGPAGAAVAVAVLAVLAVLAVATGPKGGRPDTRP